MSATVKVSSQVEVCIIKINVLSQIDISFLFNKGFEIFPTADVIFRSCKGIAKYTFIIYHITIHHLMIVGEYRHTVGV